MVQCKACNIDNPPNSTFCIECGASTNTGKEQDRIVSAEEMKQLLWSIDWEKISSDTERERLIHQIKGMYKIWQNDPSYIPIIMAPTKTSGFIQVPKNVDMKEFKKEWEKQVSTIKPGDISSGGGLNNEGLRNTSIQEMQGLGINTINTTKIDNKYTVEERLKKNYYDATRDNMPCGVCGDMRCDIKHIPPIQQQYQEAFENIQKFRKMRHDRWSSNRPFPMHEFRTGFPGGRKPMKISLPKNMKLIGNTIIRKKRRVSDIGVDTTIRADGKGPKKPKEPFASIKIRKGLDRKRKKGIKPEKVSW